MAVRLAERKPVLEVGEAMKSNLIGRKIFDVKPMGKAELEAEGWDDTGTAVVIVLDDGTKLYASRDDEGNGAGALFGTDKKGKAFRVI
jgi:hypothetical protein